MYMGLTMLGTLKYIRVSHQHLNKGLLMLIVLLKCFDKILADLIQAAGSRDPQTY
jgi:hypothetical protein